MHWLLHISIGLYFDSFIRIILFSKCLVSDLRQWRTMDVMKCHAIYTFKIETWTISQFSSLRQIQTNMKWRYRIQIWAWSVFDSTTNQGWKLIIRTSDIELPIPTTLNIKQLLWIRKVKSKRFATKHQLRINPRQKGAPKTYEPKFARGNHSHIDQ